MPLGWYLAQGLIPLGPSSSDDEEGPCVLPDGRTVCGPHGREVCHRCTTDYSILNEDLDTPTDSDATGDEENESEERVNHEIDGTLEDILAPFEPKMRRGTGLVFPTRFFPPSPTITPGELFSGRRQFMALTRITHRNDPKKGLIFTDGACLNDGQANPKAAWGFQHGLLPTGQPAVAAGRLEKKGPFDKDDREDRVQTSNRAELRAVIAALGFRVWTGEGFQSLVIATDSSYVVEGATKWTKGWIKHGWKTRNGEDVKNQDLWEALLGQVEKVKEEGLTVYLWQIPREWNTVADAAAKRAAEREETPDTWTPVWGLSV